MPNPLEVVITREFAAPRQLVFDVMTKPEHLRKTIAPFGERVTACDIDLRAGGDYHYAFVPDGAAECSFRGTYLEVEAPAKTVATWRFEGWPGVEAVETMELRDVDGRTAMTWTLAFCDQAGRDRMTRTDGPESNFDQVEAYLRELLS